MLKPVALIFAALALSIASFGQAPPDGPYQIGYASNLNIGDSVVNISNDGAMSTVEVCDIEGEGEESCMTTDPSMCVNVYTFDPQEEMLSCCTCLVTPNGLESLSVKTDLISNTLTPSIPNSITITLLSTTPTSDSTGALTVCNPSRPTPAMAGLNAWGTTLEPAGTVGTYGVIPVNFRPGALNMTSEGLDLFRVCGFLQSQGSNFGICSSCNLGALSGAKK